MPPSRQEVIEGFVVRARRIEAHSLVRDPVVLASHAEDRFEMNLLVDGTTRLTHRLPPDEEVFESLAARVRPLLLGQESIYHTKVTKALKRLLDAAPDTAAQQHRNELADLKNAWNAAASGDTYSVAQLARSEDPQNVTPASNVLLAEAWMYIDLVHVDPDQTRRAALDCPMRTRYVAAVRYYCRVAQLVVRTLRYVEKLREAGVVELDHTMWEREVVVGSDFVEEAVLYTAPVGTEPTGEDYSEEPGGRWTRFTLIEAVRQDPRRRLRAVFRGSGGNSLAEYDGAFVPRPSNGDEVRRVDVLITDGVVCHLRLPAVPNAPGPVSMELAERSETNSADLARYRFLLLIDEAATVEFYGEGDEEPHLTFTAPDLTDEQSMRAHASVEVLEDLQVVECLTGRRLGRFTGVTNDAERVLLRVTRMLYEGSVVKFVRSFGPRVEQSGELPQEEHSCFVREEPKTITVAGVEVPMPAFVLWHPQVSTQDLGPSPEHGTDARMFQVVTPAGQFFFALAPEFCSVASDDLAQHARTWDLHGIDQHAFT
ncbi:hypothetical protein UK23_42550 [Lentzea aerocolonigenes]|uniref:Uncharacterized protein n=1 Tax=Lentzea aerocolonigenes TaxID=68170 RepID=A0A0F0GFS3_LENAE|nr:hypothetical protein [Lentzea aerocolonigenes]KJK35826.1 hypothetical protein UK23_42550 [Lentzea aerocolonigenes]